MGRGRGFENVGGDMMKTVGLGGGGRAGLGAGTLSRVHAVIHRDGTENMKNSKGHVPSDI